MTTLNRYFPEKEVKKSPFDKKWFTPSIKDLHRKKQREFFKNGRSQKFLFLQNKFRHMKRDNIKNYYTNLTAKLKKTNPRNYFQVIKMLSGTQNASGSEWDIEELSELTASAAADKIADHFSAISCSYQPVQLDRLPAFLPAPPPPQVTEWEVYMRLKKMKHTRSTYHIDLPQKLRKEYDIFLSGPLADIYNTCLSQNIYPDIWKLEHVTPIGKLPHVKKMSDIRKIAITSEYSKLLESFIKDWILKDISQNLDPCQYGSRKGSGTEHLIVQFVDRILKMLDSVTQRSAVIAAAVDWSAAFDRLDPTITTQKLIKIGVRPTLVSILISYMTNRRMIVKFQGEKSSTKSLVGGGPQGTLLGGLEYIISNDDCLRDETHKEDRFKYYDDLNLVEFLILRDKLREYEFSIYMI